MAADFFSVCRFLSGHTEGVLTDMRFCGDDFRWQEVWRLCGGSHDAGHSAKRRNNHSSQIQFPHICGLLNLGGLVDLASLVLSRLPVAEDKEFQFAVKNIYSVVHEMDCQS